MKAICLNCTLKRSPEPTSTGALAQVLLDALGEQGIASEQIRLADHQVEPGVVMDLEGFTYLVTGANRGIGRAVAQRLTHEPVRLLISLWFLLVL